MIQCNVFSLPYTPLQRRIHLPQITNRGRGQQWLSILQAITRTLTLQLIPYQIVFGEKADVQPVNTHTIFKAAAC